MIIKWRNLNIKAFTVYDAQMGENYVKNQ